jgi:hypothetical protein
MRRTAWFSLLVVLVLAGPTSAVAHADARRATGGWDSADLDAARDLIAHVPDGVRPGCTMHNIRAPGGDPAVVASIDCSVTRDGAAYTLSYTQYDSVEEMQADYDELLAEPVGYVRPDGCDEGGTYSVDDETVGSWTCVPTERETSIVYTYEPSAILATLSQVLTATGSTDTAALDAFWNDFAGPNASAGTVPPLQSAPDAKRARRALLARIPRPIRAQCVADRQSFENPWIAAQYECEHPSPGVWLVRYTSFVDDDGFAAAYEEDRFLASHDEYETDDCPDSGTWGSGKVTRGRFACTVDESNSYVLWTSDRERIVAYAFAQAGDMTTSEFLRWWNGEAGPVA